MRLALIVVSNSNGFYETYDVSSFKYEVRMNSEVAYSNKGHRKRARIALLVVRGIYDEPVQNGGLPKLTSCLT